MEIGATGPKFLEHHLATHSAGQQKAAPGWEIAKETAKMIDPGHHRDPIEYRGVVAHLMGQTTEGVHATFDFIAVERCFAHHSQIDSGTPSTYGDLLYYERPFGSLESAGQMSDERISDLRVVHSFSRLR